VRVARLISFVLILSVGGLSSSFALCVSACASQTPSTAESHACHDQTGGVSIAADEGTCPHGTAIVPQGDITRDTRSPLTIAQPFASLNPATAATTTVPTLASVHPPGRPVSGFSILRI
jgi:hypothetical protein